MIDKELRWHDLKTETPPADRCVVLFPQISDVGIFFDIDRLFCASNHEYARMTALVQGYTHWFPIPSAPGEAEVRARVQAEYDKEQDPHEQFMKGFGRAVENITDFVKDIVPDRPNVALAIESRFGGGKKDD